MALSNKKEECCYQQIDDRIQNNSKQNIYSQNMDTFYLAPLIHGNATEIPSAPENYDIPSHRPPELKKEKPSSSAWVTVLLFFMTILATAGITAAVILWFQLTHVSEQLKMATIAKNKDTYVTSPSNSNGKIPSNYPENCTEGTKHPCEENRLFYNDTCYTVSDFLNEERLSEPPTNAPDMKPSSCPDANVATSSNSNEKCEENRVLYNRSCYTVSNFCNEPFLPESPEMTPPFCPEGLILSNNKCVPEEVCRSPCREDQFFHNGSCLNLSGIFDTVSLDASQYTDILLRILGPGYSNCSTGWISWSNACYKYIEERKNWTAAEEYCLSLSSSAHLTSIHSEEEQTFIYDTWRRLRDPNTIITRDRPKMHLGLTDTESEGIFIWTDGTQMDYENWLSGQPNTYGNQDVVRMYDGTHNGSGKWGDDNISRGDYAFFCKYVPVCYQLR